MVLTCTELTWSGEGGPATGSFSRWDLGEDTLLTITVTTSETPPEAASVTVLRGWFADRLGAGSITKDELRAAMQVQPESVTPTAEAFLVDGVPAAGVVLTARGVIARSTVQGGVVVTVVHGDAVNGPIELVTEMPALT